MTIFRSVFEATNDFPNYPYCFRIKIDKHDRNSQDILLAVGTEKEFSEWLVGLHEAVHGANAPVPTDIPGATFAEREDEVQRFVPGLGRSSEEDDLATALAESLRETNEQTQITPEAQESASSAQPPYHSNHNLEESKEEIGDASNRSEAELEAALVESLRFSHQEHGVR